MLAGAYGLVEGVLLARGMGRTLVAG